MYSFEQIKQAFESFVKQTSTSTFKIKYDDSETDYHISLNYDIEGKQIISNDSFPILKINNYKLFLSSLEQLINIMSEFYESDMLFFDFNDNNFLDYLLLSCFTNMNEFDFNNPINYLNRIIKSYEHEYDLENSKLVGNLSLNTSNISIYESTVKNSATMEAPIHKKYILTDNKEAFVLPKIHYYISEDIVYITGIQNTKIMQKNSLSKKLDRYFRKVDAGLSQIEKSIDGSVSTIKDISPNFLVALTLFISSLKNYKIFCLIDYLPLRYQNKLGVLRLKNIDVEEADIIQTNITNKFILTGVRFCEHFDNASFYHDNNLLRIHLEKYIHKNGNIIYDLYESINPKKRKY